MRSVRRSGSKRLGDSEDGTKIYFCRTLPQLRERGEICEKYVQTIIKTFFVPFTSTSLYREMPDNCYYYCTDCRLVQDDIMNGKRPDITNPDIASGNKRKLANNTTSGPKKKTNVKYQANLVAPYSDNLIKDKVEDYVENNDIDENEFSLEKIADVNGEDLDKPPDTSPIAAKEVERPIVPFLVFNDKLSGRALKRSKSKKKIIKDETLNSVEESEVLALQAKNSLIAANLLSGVAMTSDVVSSVPGAVITSDIVSSQLNIISSGTEVSIPNCLTISSDIALSDLAKTDLPLKRDAAFKGAIKKFFYDKGCVF
jgi:hypothetical protein